MGIAGHVLGDKRLAQLRRQTGIPFDRAYIRNGYGEGVMWLPDENCAHFAIDPLSGEVELLTDVGHWSSCPCARSAG